MDRWRFVITKLDHTPIREVSNAYERKFNANLSKPSTATFNLRKDNPLLPYFFEDESKLLQVWKNSDIQMWGPIISANYNQTEGAPATVAVSAADVSWRLTRRFADFSEKGTPTTGDKGNVANGIVANVNAIANCGLTYAGDLSGSEGGYTLQPYKEALAMINELAHGIDGFDWYVEPLLGNETYIGNLRLAAVVGDEKPGAVFDYGIGRRNMRSMGFMRDISTEANVAWNVSESGLIASAENPTPVVVAFDTPAIEQHGRLEEVVELSGVNNVALRTAWVEENVRVRKAPRRVLSMTSDIDDGSERVPQFGEDYWLGDRVPARALVEGTVLFNGLARVYSVQIALNDAGTAMVTPILVDEGE